VVIIFIYKHNYFLYNYHNITRLLEMQKSFTSLIGIWLKFCKKKMNLSLQLKYF